MRITCQDVTFSCRRYGANGKQEFDEGSIEIKIKHSDSMSELLENFENFCLAMGFHPNTVQGCIQERAEELEESEREEAN